MTRRLVLLPIAVLATSVGCGGEDASASAVALHAGAGAPCVQWVRRVGDFGCDDGMAVSRLGDDGLVVTGVFAYTVVFGEGEANETILTADGTPYPDMFVARYDLTGALVWARRAGGTGRDEGWGIDHLPGQGVWVTGRFGGDPGDRSATFGEGEPGETTLTGLSDIFVAKYDDSGSLVFARSAGGELGDEGNDIALVSDGTARVTGFYGGIESGAGATFGAGEANETFLDGGGGFIASYDAVGALIWAKSAGSRTGWNVTAAPSGSAWIVVGLTGPATFGAGEPNETTLDGVGIAVARYEPTGALAWVRKAGDFSAGTNLGIDVATDESVRVTGGLGNEGTFGAGEANETILSPLGSSDVFVARYSDSGTLQWARRAGSEAEDRGHGVAALGDGSMLVAGNFAGTATFGAGEVGETTLTSSGERDIFLAKYDPSGQVVWARRAGGPNQDLALDLAVLVDGSAVVTGRFEEPTATFFQGEAEETTITSGGNCDVFIARFCEAACSCAGNCPAVCGDGCCAGVEDCASCPDDCGSCGDSGPEETLDLGTEPPSDVGTEQPTDSTTESPMDAGASLDAAALDVGRDPGESEPGRDAAPPKADAKEVITEFTPADGCSCTVGSVGARSWPALLVWALASIRRRRRRGSGSRTA